MQQQIRPKVRKRTQPKVATSEDDNGSNTKDGNKSSEQVEETRQRLENWMGLGQTTTSSSIQSSDIKVDNTSTVLAVKEEPALGTKKTIQLASAFSQNDEESGAAQAKSPNAISKTPPKSILRQPKYSQPHKTALESTITPPEQPPSDGTPAPQTIPSHSSSTPAFPGKIVERDPMTAIAQRQKKKTTPLPSTTSTTIEGYIPQTNSASASTPPSNPTVTPSFVASMPSVEDEDNDNDNSNEPDPLILNSVEELFQAAGDPQLTVPDAHRVTPDAQLVEADLSFSVLSQDQFQGKLPELRRQHEEEHQAQLQMFLGTEDVFDEEDDEEGGADDEEEEDWMEMLMQGGGEEDDNEDENAMNPYQDDAEEEEERELRAFRQLWDALSEWTTPEAVAYSQHLQSFNDGGDETSWKTPLLERSDVESSRCAGLMAMIKLYLPKSLQELGFAHDIRRKADTRLGELLRTFNYSREAPKLPVKLWKAMTCILLEVVMNAGVDSALIVAVPPAAGAVGLSLDEYRYLSRTAVATFAKSSKSDD
eukprot:Nitzschia sp. Nitz4//scaffold133_size116822//20411//22018//NITZ4_003795-RA/size116822-processed-gene-0.23-mRNA-1//1//CDS//3329535360//6007//frame0